MSRFSLLALVLALAAAVFAACGGGDDEGDGDPAELLRTAFTEAQNLESAVLDLSIDGTLEGEQGGEFSVSVSGPTVAGGENDIGSADLDVSASATIAGIGALTGGSDELSIEGGLVIADQKLYIEYDGETYVADENTFEQIAPGLGEILSAGTTRVDQEQVDQFIENLSDLSNEGTEDVEGVEATHISGQLDAEGLQALAESQDEDLPTDFDLSELDPLQFDMWVGTEDNLMRRMQMALQMDAPEEAQDEGVDSIDFQMSITLSEVNEPQTIEAPKNARPLEELLGGLSELFGPFSFSFSTGEQNLLDPDAANGGSGNGGNGRNGGGGNGGGGNGPAAGSPQEIAECLEQAGQDPEAIEACLTQ
ncbi:MAG TPA: LppX_LprAFG lipoprotein [Solirubrobacterales bacterium]|jgi:hypothetical protein